MTELKFYRLIMVCLVLLAVGVGIKRYGDYRVNEFLSREAPAGLVAAASHGAPVNHADNYPLPQISQPLRQPPAADPWRAPAVTAYGNAPLAVAGSTHRPTSAGAIGTLTDQPISPPAAPSWQPPRDPVSPPTAPIAVPEDPVVAQIRELKRQLGGTGVGEILGGGQGIAADWDTEATFAEAVRELRAEQAARPEGSAERPALPVFANGMEPEEIVEVRQHLRQFADRVAADSPERAAAYQRLAKRLGDSESGSESQKR